MATMVTSFSHQEVESISPHLEYELPYVRIQKLSMSIPIFMACNYLHKFNKNLFWKQKIGNTDCMTNALTAMSCLRKTSIVSDIIR